MSHYTSQCQEGKFLEYDIYAIVYFQINTAWLRKSHTNIPSAHASNFETISCVDFSDILQMENNKNNYLPDLLSIDFDDESMNEILSKLNQIISKE